MIKLGNLSRWVALPVGATLTLPGEDVRRIGLSVNSPGIADLRIVNADGEVKFLASVDGLDEIEFYEEGVVKITTSSPDVAFMTSSIEVDYFVNDAPEVFTEISERAARNPDLERMEYLMRVNMENRMAQLSAGLEERIAGAYAAGQLAAVPQPPAANPPADGGKPAKPAPKPGAPAPAGGEDLPADAGEGEGD